MYIYVLLFVLKRSTEESDLIHINLFPILHRNGDSSVLKVLSYPLCGQLQIKTHPKVSGKLSLFPDPKGWCCSQSDTQVIHSLRGKWEPAMKTQLITYHFVWLVVSFGHIVTVELGNTNFLARVAPHEIQCCHILLQNQVNVYAVLCKILTCENVRSQKHFDKVCWLNQIRILYVA